MAIALPTIPSPCFVTLTHFSDIRHPFFWRPPHLQILDLSPWYHLPLLSTLLVYYFYPLEGKFRALGTMLNSFLYNRYLVQGLARTWGFLLFFSFPFGLLFLEKFLYDKIEVHSNYSINRNNEKKSLHKIQQKYIYIYIYHTK